MKKSLIQLAFNPCFNPFLHSTTGTLYPGFGYPFRHYWVTTYISRVTHSVIELFTLTYSIERTAFVVLNWKRSLFFCSSFFWAKKKSWNPAYSCCKDFLGYWVTFFRSLIEKNQKCSEKSLNRECLHMPNAMEKISNTHICTINVVEFCNEDKMKKNQSGLLYISIYKLKIYVQITTQSREYLGSWQMSTFFFMNIFALVIYSLNCVHHVWLYVVLHCSGYTELNLLLPLKWFLCAESPTPNEQLQSPAL